MKSILRRLKSRIDKGINRYCRGFNDVKFWKLYKKARSANSFVAGIYNIKLMRKCTKCGGYLGRKAEIKGKPFLPHGMNGIHISTRAVIGNNVTIYQNVTIGEAGGAPVIGDNVFIGASAVILGGITIGNNAKIGAGAIVVDDVPDNTTVVSPKAVPLNKNANL